MSRNSYSRSLEGPCRSQVRLNHNKKGRLDFKGSSKENSMAKSSMFAFFIGSPHPYLDWTCLYCTCVLLWPWETWDAYCSDVSVFFMVCLTLQRCVKLQSSNQGGPQNRIGFVLQYATGSNSHPSFFLIPLRSWQPIVSWVFLFNFRGVVFAIFWLTQ